MQRNDRLYGLYLQTEIYSMRQLLILSLLGLLFLAGCKKNMSSTCGYSVSTIIAPVIEQQALHDSLTAHGITATLNSTGFYFNINAAGSGPSATNLCSTFSVFYKGGFLNGHVFDSSRNGAPVIFSLGQVIPGWQKGLPLVSKGGDITLYIPPSLAYGSTDVKDSSGNVVIPANSILVFRVIVADLQP